MANNENLKPFNELTESKQREITQKGGIASGEARREAKILKQSLEIALDIYNEKAIKEAKKIGREDLVEELTKCGYMAIELIKIATNTKNKPEVRLRALDTIIDRTEGKPTQTNLNINKEYKLDEDDEKDMDEAIERYKKRKDIEQKIEKQNKTNDKNTN